MLCFNRVRGSQPPLSGPPTGELRSMTTDQSSDAGLIDPGAPTVLPQAVRQRIFLYLGFLIILLAFGSPSGGLIDIPITFFMKNKLHLEAHELAIFRLVAAIPLYLSF